VVELPPCWKSAPASTPNSPAAQSRICNRESQIQIVAFAEACPERRGRVEKFLDTPIKRYSVKRSEEAEKL
jgi:hypothetical protein